MTSTSVKPAMTDEIVEERAVVALQEAIATYGGLISDTRKTENDIRSAEGKLTYVYDLMKQVHDYAMDQRDLLRAANTENAQLREKIDVYAMRIGKMQEQIAKAAKTKAGVAE